MRGYLALVVASGGLLACETEAGQEGCPGGDCAAECNGDEYRVRGECRALTACSAAQYQLIAPTERSDRVCATLTTCRSTQYERKAPTATSDRECKSLTECRHSQYESTSPTATSDRECSALTECARDEFEVKAPTDLSDRECHKTTVCDDSSYEVKAPTATSDRVCEPVGACPAGSYTAAPGWCRPITECKTLEYEAVAPTATSDRSCERISTCTRTQYEVAAPTASSDRVCADLTACAPGEREIVAPTPTSDRVCGSSCIGDAATGDVDGDGTCDNLDFTCSFNLPTATTVPLDPTCLVPDIVVDDPWNLAVELTIPSPSGGGSYSAPLVANLDDDNNDGIIDDRDTPELIYTDLDYVNGLALIARRSDGSELFRRTDFDAWSTPLIADIDQDGAPEIVGRLTNGDVVALSADGDSIEWTSDTPASLNYFYGVVPTIGDADDDGDLEIAYEVLNEQGMAVRLVDATTGNTLWEHRVDTVYSTPVMADLDRDGSAEVIFGNTIFNGAGDVVWLGDAAETNFNAVADVDGDADGEVISVIASGVTIVDADGTEITTWPLLHGLAFRPGPACVADFDGDGTSEIAIPSSDEMQVYEFDGTPVWDTPAAIQDFSGIAGCTGYDVDGDGRFEILFADEVTFWIFDGLTGDVNFEESAHSSGTIWEYPTVADFDKDGSAEVFIASNGYDDSGAVPGIVVYGHAGSGWARAGSTWAIHDYAPNKIASDNTVAVGGAQPWQIQNLYRARPTVETAASDLRITFGDACVSSCLDGGVVNVAFRVTNHGQTTVPAGIVVSLWATGDDAPIASVTLDEPVVSGQSVSASLATNFGSIHGSLELRVDAEGNVGECDRSNNAVAVINNFCGGTSL